MCLHDGARCEDPKLACNTSAEGYGAEVICELSAGQVVSLGTHYENQIGYSGHLTGVRSPRMCDLCARVRR